MPTVGGAIEPADRAEHPLSSTAKPLVGRIFSSPSERLGHRAVPTGEVPSMLKSGAAAPIDRRVVNGAVSSSTQGRAVWINGAAIGNSLVNKSAWTDGSGKVWLRDGRQGTRLIRPGQSIDRNGTIEDLLPAGSVMRR
jgi:hypothetical protein